MTQGSGEAEQIVHIVFQGVDIALRLSGSAVKNLAQLIYVALKDDKNLNMRSGEVKRIASLLKENKPLQTYKIDRSDLKQFRKLAKQYGVLYTAIKDARSTDSQCTIILKAEEVPMLNEVLEQMGLKGAIPKESATKKDQARSEKSSNSTNENTPDRADTKQDLSEIIVGINNSDKDKLTANNWKEFLKVQANLYGYSAKNRDLIAQQLPTASIVMSKSKWRELGRFPDKNSNGIEIVRPDIIDGKKTDNFIKATVYDISQTYGRQLRKSEVAVTLKEGSLELTAEIERLKSISTVPVETVENLETKGVYDTEQKKILLREGLSQTETYKELISESVYADAHKQVGDSYIRGDYRFRADSTAYAVMYKNGMDTSSFTFDYIPDEVNGLDGKDVSELLNATKSSVATGVKQSEKRLEEHKTKQKPSVKGRLENNKEGVKPPTKAIKPKEKTK